MVSGGTCVMCNNSEGLNARGTADDTDTVRELSREVCTPEVIERPLKHSFRQQVVGAALRHR